MNKKNIQIKISEELGSTSGILMIPEDSTHLIILGHGAGAGMTHTFMDSLSENLYENGVATLRYNFLYMDRGKKAPDRPKVAHPTIEAVIEKTKALYPEKKIHLAGKSFGGRMASQLMSSKEETIVNSLIFYGFPLHPAGKPEKAESRAEHLFDVKIPMLFLQGTRDTLAKVDLIEKTCSQLQNATLNILEGGDHSFKTLKRSGISHEEMIKKLADETLNWVLKI